VTDFIATSDAATVQRLARIIREGTAAECVQAFDDLNAGSVGVELWDRAMALVDTWSEAESGGVA
jgi:hypothetical protein